MAIFTMLFLLVAGHALCDYPLQGDFLARGKNHKAPLPGIPWYQCLFAHSMIHAAMVYLITRSIWLGIAELVMHAVTDWGKCDGRHSFNQDQAIHIGCKVLWVIVWAIAYGAR